MQIIAGETVATEISVTDGNNDPINITGYTVKMQIDFEEPLLLDTGNSGITITDGPAGKFQINISDIESAALDVGSFSYDCWMISGGGVSTPLLNGVFTVTQNITPIP